MSPEEIADIEEARITEGTRWTAKAGRRIEISSYAEDDDVRNVVENKPDETLSLRDEPPMNDEENRQHLLSEAKAEKARLLAEIKNLLSEELGFDVGDVGHQVIEATSVTSDDENLKDSENLLDDRKYQGRALITSDLEKVQQLTSGTKVQSKDDKQSPMDEGEISTDCPSVKVDIPEQRGESNSLIERGNSKEEIVVNEVPIKNLIETENEKSILDQNKIAVDIKEDEIKQKEVEVKLNGFSSNEDENIESLKEELKEEKNVFAEDEGSCLLAPKEEDFSPREQGLAEIKDKEELEEEQKILKEDEGNFVVPPKEDDCPPCEQALAQGIDQAKPEDVAEMKEMAEKEETKFMNLSKSVESFEEIQTKRWEGLRAAGHAALTRYFTSGWKLNGQKCKGEHCDESPIVEKAEASECLVCGGSGSGKDGVYTGVYTGVHAGVTNELNAVEESKVGDTQDDRKLQVRFKCADGLDIFSCGIFYTYDDIDLPSDSKSIANKIVSESVEAGKEEELSQLTAEQIPWDEYTITSEVGVKELIDNVEKMTINTSHAVSMESAEPQEQASNTEESTNKIDKDEFNQMYQRELASQEIGRMIIKGWTILNESCTNCDMPILGGERGQVVCVLCGTLDANDDETIASEVDNDYMPSNSDVTTEDKPSANPLNHTKDKNHPPKTTETPKNDPPAIIANERFSKQHKNLRAENTEEPILRVGVKHENSKVDTGIAFTENSRDINGIPARYRGVTSLGTPEDIARTRTSRSVAIPNQNGNPEDSLNVKPWSQLHEATRKEYPIEYGGPPRPEGSARRLGSGSTKEAQQGCVSEHESSKTDRYSETTSSQIESITISSPRGKADVAAQAFDVILERMEQCKSRILSSPTDVQLHEIALIEKLAAAAVAVKKFSDAE